MYVLNDFLEELRSFVRALTKIDVVVKLPTVRREVFGDVLFYFAGDFQHLVGKLMDCFTVVDRCSCTPKHVSVWLNKAVWTADVVKQILTTGRDYGRNAKFNSTVLAVGSDSPDDTVTTMRIALLQNVIVNLALVNGCELGNSGFNIFVSKTKNHQIFLLCGSVNCNATISEYKQRKLASITELCARHIGPDEDYPVETISKICHASIVIELLSVRHNKVVTTDCETTTKDSGIFIMYNYSRLCKLWSTYEKGVEAKHYEPLPNIDDINFSLLTSKEEWLLILNYLSAYPSVVRESFKFALTAHLGVHKLCLFLTEMSSNVSLCYHRHRILSDDVHNRGPLMYARLYLVKSAIQVYENIFHLLGIEGVCAM